MKKLLIIDRDGTIIKEPPGDFQVDSLDKLSFLPGTVTSLNSISKLDFELVLATNQDGLGTDSFPEDTFWPAHNKMLDLLSGEGVIFTDQLIDRSFEQDGKPTRKPGTGMFTDYLNGDYDLSASYVIGDRITDIILARNLGAKGILLQPPTVGEKMVRDNELTATCVLITNSWPQIAQFLRSTDRRATVKRKTRETDIELVIDLDGKIPSCVSTGLNFFDHMLDQIVHHSGISLQLKVHGDLHVDEHHTIEDTGIALGEAFNNALGSKRGIERYGFSLPMDECSATVLVDLGGRIDFIWDVQFQREKIGDVPTEMFSHFFKSFAQSAKCNLHISALGENEHHKIEGVFKAFARALRSAVRRDVFSYELPSSKGIL